MSLHYRIVKDDNRRGLVADCRIKGTIKLSSFRNTNILKFDIQASASRRYLF
jgi:hypothetical protein